MCAGADVGIETDRGFFAACATDPLQAIDDELRANQGYTGVVVSTLPEEKSRWLRMALPAKVAVGPKPPLVVTLAPEGVYWTNPVTEVSAAAGSWLEHTRIQRESELAHHVGLTHVDQERDSHYRSFSMARRM